VKEKNSGDAFAGRKKLLHHTSYINYTAI
jgi:hypothetical protein